MRERKRGNEKKRKKRRRLENEKKRFVVVRRFAFPTACSHNTFKTRLVRSNLPRFQRENEHCFSREKQRKKHDEGSARACRAKLEKKAQLVVATFSFAFRFRSTTAVVVFRFEKKLFYHSPSRLAIVTDLKPESGKRPRRCATWKMDCCGGWGDGAEREEVEFFSSFAVIRRRHQKQESDARKRHRFPIFFLFQQCLASSKLFKCARGV